MQVSLNLPGGFALYAWEELLAEARSAVGAVLSNLGLAVVEDWHVVDVLGPCSVFVVLGDAQRIKRQCMALEELSPRGRLWDIDVLTKIGAVDRHSVGVKGRLCWVCGQEEAHVCRRLEAHARDEVIRVAQKIARGGMQ